MTAAVAQTTDDELCVQVSDGHKWSFIVAALTKRTLQIPGIKPADRLRLLERLNGLTDDWFTADMLAGIEPMCDTGYAIFKEAKSVDAAQDNTHCQASLEVLARLKVFRHFCTLNPSILAAIKHRAADRQDRHAAPPPTETPPPRPQTVMGAAQFALSQRRSNGTPAQHRSHLPPDQINRMGGGLPDWSYDSEKDNA
jgi:hypothetical protein